MFLNENYSEKGTTILLPTCRRMDKFPTAGTNKFTNAQQMPRGIGMLAIDCNWSLNYESYVLL